MIHTKLKVIFGTAGHGEANMGFPTEKSIAGTFPVLEKHGVFHMDTAFVYGQGMSQIFLGNQTPKDKGFAFDTKWPGGFTGQPDACSKDNILAMTKSCLDALQVDKVDVFYMHSPDPLTPLESTLGGINEAYKRGAFKRFGLSNYRPEHVEAIYNLCEEKGYVLPSVYQGNYSPIMRLAEEVLFPTLKRLNISYYAYSPLAGGFLTKTPEQIVEGAGRFNENDVGGVYKAMFCKPGFLSALGAWSKVASEEGCSNAELAYRWVAYNSVLAKDPGNALIIGARTVQQLDQTLEGIEHGPLSMEAVRKIDAIWNEVKHEVDVKKYIAILE